VAPGSRLVLLAVLLAIPSAMLPIADMPATATAAPGSAGQAAGLVAESPPGGNSPFDRQGMQSYGGLPPSWWLSASLPAKAHEIDLGPSP
jgi:hypothetical protein